MSAPESARDVAVDLPDRPTALADFAEALGAAGVSLEGGGVFTHGGVAVAHFLVGDGERARAVLAAHGIGPVVVSEVVTVRLDQDVPGQLGAFARTVADAGIRIRAQYSDHDHNLVLVVDPARHDECRRLADRWRAAREGGGR